MKTLKDKIIIDKVVQGPMRYFKEEDVAQTIKELKRELGKGYDYLIQSPERTLGEQFKIIDKIFGNFEQKGSDGK